MTEHYFSQKPQTKSSPKTWKFTLRNQELTFTSDHHVFSKNQVDFGSRLLIETFEEPQVTGDFLDLGCGYGPVGVSLAKDFSNRQLVMSDVNERAMSLARENLAVNQVENAEVVASDRFENLAQHQFAAILINPPIRAGKQIVHSMFEGAHQALIQNGNLWVVIQKKQGAPSAEKKINQIFGNVEVVKKAKGYYILKAIKI